MSNQFLIHFQTIILRMKQGVNFVAMHPLPFYLMKLQKQTVKLLWSLESFQTPFSVIRE